MKRTSAWFILLAVLFAAGSETQGSIWQEDDPPKKGRVRPEPGDTGSTDPGDSSVRTGPSRVPRPTEGLASRRLVSRLTKLHEAIKEKLDLTSEQEESIRDLFDDHIRKVTEHHDQQHGNRVDEADLEELKALRNRMIEARKSGDTDTARRLRAQMTEKARAMRPPAGPSASQLIEKVAKQLEEGQLETFHAIVRRFRLDEAPTPGGGPLRAILQAVRDPQLGLSDEQRRDIRDLVRRAITGVPPGERRGARLDEVAERVRADISELLTPDQRTKLEAALQVAEQPGRRKGPPAVNSKREMPAKAEDRSGPERSDPNRPRGDER